MIGYVTLGTNDLPRAAAFYDALLAEVGAKRLWDLGRGIGWGVAMDKPSLAVMTPFPGTRMYEQYSREGRILSRNWDLYDMNHVVFQPRKMTVEELQEGHDWANARFYSYPSMLKRFFPLRRSHQVFLPSNWAMRRAWRALRKSG